MPLPSALGQEKAAANGREAISSKSILKAHQILKIQKVR